MCGVARKAGDLQSLFMGAKNYSEITWFHFEAINQGLLILSWYEHYTDKEVPPEYLWEDHEGLDMWFKRVHEDRGWTDDGDGTDYVPQDSEMMGNELARMWKD